MAADGEPRGKRVVFLSAYHDFRTRKRASIHHVASALARQGHSVTFLSTRFSLLSKLKGDSRLDLWDRSNRMESVEGVDCYLWQTAFHPFASGNPLISAAMGMLYPLYAKMPSRDVDAIFRSADYVVTESSVAAILIPRAKRLAPDARIIYYATDRLDTVGGHPFIEQALARDNHLVDHVCVRSARMAPHFPWAAGRMYRASFGIDPQEYAGIGPSPYPAERKVAVAVGSMLFDPGFFTAVAAEAPDVDFHVIGCGMRFDAPSNVIIHDEMPFRATLPYVKHADVGIAAYHQAPGVDYLVDSSLKLAQYEYLGLPAVCPDFAAGDNPRRFGYRTGDPRSMRAALDAALANGPTPPVQFNSWDEVARRVLHPSADDRVGLSGDGAQACPGQDHKSG